MQMVENQYWRERERENSLLDCRTSLNPKLFAEKKKKKEKKELIL